MAGRKMLLPLLLIAILSAGNVASPVPPTAIKAGYWPSWSASYQPPTTIDTSLFTHLFYAFVGLEPVSYHLMISQSDHLLISNFTATMRSQKPPVKILLSIGGGGANSTTFARMVGNPSNRRTFINSTIAVARIYGFDGLDLDWEFPANRREMSNLGRLLSEWRLAVEEEACATGWRRLLITAAVYFSSNFFLSHAPYAYPAVSLGQNLDFINAMCYDYCGSWNTSKTGAHAALYDPTSNVSTSSGIDSWIRAGVSPKKIIMGLPLYGRTWELNDAGVHGIGAPAISVGPGENGIMTFAQVANFNREKNATVVYDDDTVSTYSYTGPAWIGYDDEASITKKIQFAIDRRLGGYFLWAISYDKDWNLSRQASKAWRH